MTEVGEKGLTLRFFFNSSGFLPHTVTDFGIAVVKRPELLWLVHYTRTRRSCCWTTSSLLLTCIPQKSVVDEALLGDLIKDRTVILVTHNIAACSSSRRARRQFGKERDGEPLRVQ